MNPSRSVRAEESASDLSRKAGNSSRGNTNYYIQKIIGCIRMSIWAFNIGISAWRLLR